MQITVDIYRVDGSYLWAAAVYVGDTHVGLHTFRTRKAAIKWAEEELATEITISIGVR